ncbi:MAG: ATP-binding protein [Verrucomicrobiota bacterium]
MEPNAKYTTLDAENLGILMDFVKAEGLPTSSYQAGEIIINESTPNHNLYVILTGQAELTRESKHLQNKKIIVDVLGPGSFLGLISFWSGRPTLSKSRATEDTTCLIFTADSFDRVRERFSKLSNTVDHLLIGNLCDRVQRMSELNTQNAELSMALENERNHLRDTLRELEETRERLAHSERLAVMGQLIAGIAHEINNPAAALRQSLDGLLDCTKHAFETKHSKTLSPQSALKLRELGLHQDQPDTATIRAHLKSLETAYPNAQRSLLRRFASLPKTSDPDLSSLVKKSLSRRAQERAVPDALVAFETGAYLRTAQLTTERIFGLVRSLRRYGKPQNSAIEATDITTCIQDTRVVLNHRLKHYELSLELPELPRAQVAPGEINQVITNLLVNAMDATPEGGKISVSTMHQNESIQICIRDSGSGIKPDNLQHIFETNFTTKNSNQHFGLGLGLSISKEIIEQYGGTISAENNTDQGACFTINLPTAISHKLNQ